MEHQGEVSRARIVCVLVKDIYLEKPASAFSWDLGVGRGLIEI